MVHLKVVKVNGADSTDQALMVSTASREEVGAWDREKIADSLRLETNLAESTAAEVAEAVEERISNLGLERVTTTQVREFIDVELLARGFTAAARTHSLMSIPAANMDSILTGANNENSNTTYNPESVNLTIAELMLKQYALAYVYSQDVAEAHLRGDIHVHDLGMVVRPYTYHRDTLVETEDGRMVTLADLYEEYPFEESPEDDTWVKYPQDGLRIRDAGEMVEVRRLVKRLRQDKSMLFVKTADGSACIVTHDHPMLVMAEEGFEQKRADELETGDPLCTVAPPRLGSGMEVDLGALLVASGKAHNYAVLFEDGVSLPLVQAIAYLQADKVSQNQYAAASIVTCKGAWQDRLWPTMLPLTETLGWTIGFIIGDGHVESSGQFGITGKIDSAEFEEAKRRLDELGIDYSVELHSENCERIRFTSSVLRDVFIGGVIGKKARDKKLPWFCWTANRDFLGGLVAGVVDADGSVEKNGTITVRVASAGLVFQLVQVLRMLGFKPTCRKPEGVGSAREYNGRIIEQKYGLFCVAFRKYNGVDIPSLKTQGLRIATKQRTSDPSPSCSVVQIEPVDIPDEYIYDVTTESGTLLANGIWSKNCGGHSLEYVKKYGLALPNITSVSGPAKHPEVLVGHMVKMASTLQMNYAGAVGWESVNLFFAPFLVGLPYERVRQIAQMLIFEFNQLAGARGGQVVFTDFNIYYGVPARFQDTPALVPGGMYRAVKDGGLGGVLEAPDVSEDLPEGYRWLTYKDYEWESNVFARALFDVYLGGDAVGQTFYFPKPLLHINQEGMDSPGWEEFFELACRVASEKGTTYFVFDRDDTCISACCRLKLKWDMRDIERSKTPESLRFSALQNTTINLPRLAYKAEGDTARLYELLQEHVDLASRSHLQKRKFIRKLLGMGVEGPLSFFSTSRDGGAYLRLDELTCLVGIFGLNECVQFHTGHQLHEADTAALEFGVEIISRLHDMVEEASERYKIKMVIEETPAESSGYRLATLDLHEYPEQTRSVLKGDPGNGSYYYTNSVHLAVDAPVDFIERIEMQSRFHQYIKGGAIIHVWLGEHEPCPASIAKVVMKTYEKTEAHQICFSPEFTVCEACKRTTRGLSDECSECGSEDVYGITRIVGYFSKIQSWNKGKKSELVDRVREIVV